MNNLLVFLSIVNKHTHPKTDFGAIIEINLRYLSKDRLDQSTIQERYKTIHETAVLLLVVKKKERIHNLSKCPSIKPIIFSTTFNFFQSLESIKLVKIKLKWQWSGYI